MKKANKNEDIYNELGNRIVDLIEEYKDRISPPPMVQLLIENAVTCALCCAPNEGEGYKFILDCVITGMKRYEENFS